MKRERRFSSNKLKIEKRSVDGQEMSIITGYALLYNSISANLGCPGWFDWYEMIAPGAFSDSLSNMNAGIGDEDCVALFNHDTNLILGRSSAGTLELTDDSTGLGYSIKAPNTQYANDLCENIRVGNVTGSSFAMTVDTEDYRRIDGKEVRIVVKGRLYDVSPVVYPAYPSTNGLVSVRSGDMTQEEYFELSRKRATKSPDSGFRQRKLRLHELG